jgi:hypothetical protein
MEHATEANHIQSLILDAIEMSEKQFDLNNPPHFDEIARICRNNNRISDEIIVLQLAVGFYGNSDLQCQERELVLSKFRAKLSARRKEAKVLEVLGW